ncbi:hypothetical protein GPL21_39140, partial [Bradyrhizobium pachyrhizi]
MADWYVSSTAYAAIPAFQTSHAYSVGDILRPTAASGVNQYPQRCTTAGTSGGSEPSWSNSNNGTTTSGGATFTNVGGQSTYGWSAALGTLYALNQGASKNASPGDRVFLSSDHSESNVGGNYYFTASSSVSTIKVISVNKAGSVPPVAADLQAGASISVNTTLTFDSTCPYWFDGITFTQTANSSVNFNGFLGNKSFYFKNCAFVFSSSGGATNFTNTQRTCKVTFDNTTLQTADTNTSFRASYGFDFTWLNTPSAIVGATKPSLLFLSQSTGIMLATLRGVDLSALTGTLVAYSFNSNNAFKVLFDSCKINSSVTRYQSPSGINSVTGQDEVELVNCFDGTNIINERYTPFGTSTADTSTYLSGGAADDVGNYSKKMVTNSNTELAASPMEGFWMDVQQSSIGSVLTATVELVSSSSLNNTDIKLQLEYQGTSGSSVATITESNANVLTATAALTSSSATWNSPPSTPVYQKL